MIPFRLFFLGIWLICWSCKVQIATSGKFISPNYLRVFRKQYFAQKFTVSSQKKTFSLCKSFFFRSNRTNDIKRNAFVELINPELLSFDSLPKMDETKRDVLNAMNQANSFLKLDDWELLGQEDGIIVWRLKSILTGVGSEWPCIKSITTVDMTPEALQDLLMDSNRVHLLNKYSAGRVDIESISKQTKIVWNKTKLPYAMKPYDFCSLMHCCVDPVSGHSMIVSKAVKRDSAPVTSEFARSEILLGINVLAPSPSNESQTEMTSISHVRLANLPVYFARKSAFQGTVNYLSQLKAAVTKLNGIAMM